MILDESTHSSGLIEIWNPNEAQRSAWLSYYADGGYHNPDHLAIAATLPAITWFSYWPDIKAQRGR